MAGVPLLNGFLSKEMFFAEAVGVATQLRFGWLLPPVVTLAGVFAVAYSLRFIHDVFFNGEPIGLTKTPHEPPHWMRVPVEVLVVLCLVVGILPALTVDPILAVAVAGVLQGPPPDHDLAIWHGASPALWMSVIALTGGGSVYLGRKPLFAFYERHADRLEARWLYDRLLNGLFALAGALTRLLDTGSLQRLLFVTILSALVLGVAGFLGAPGPLTGVRARLPMDGVSLLATVGLMAAAVGAVVLHRQRLVALILMGAVGLVIALIFVKFSALGVYLVVVGAALLILIHLGLMHRAGRRAARAAPNPDPSPTGEGEPLDACQWKP
jgi:multicomponent K+:H+ antiporter subunit A